MKKMKEAKSSAFYQQQYRQRLREQGLVKKEVWILPEYASKLLEVEKQLRVTQANITSESFNKQKGNDEMVKNVTWTVANLYQELSKTELFKNRAVSVEVIEGIDPCLHIIMHDYGDLPLFLSISNQQIVVEALLWSVDMVKDTAKFNEEVLCTRKLFPLSTIAIEQAGDGSVNYIMYGALSSSSLLSSIVYEIETLTDNVIKATEAYEHILNV
ncbi:YjfI family protein [Orbaceae bacterium ac157xtp]